MKKPKSVSPPIGKSTPVRIGGLANDIICRVMKRNGLSYKSAVEAIILQWSELDQQAPVKLGKLMLKYCAEGATVEDAAVQAITGKPPQKPHKPSNGIGKPQGAPERRSRAGKVASAAKASYAVTAGATEASK